MKWHMDTIEHNQGQVRCLVGSAGKRPTIEGGYDILVSERGPDAINIWNTPEGTVYTRWCVFHQGRLEYYCGDIDIHLSLDEVKAVAATMWRLGGFK
jgi:hypothetical protein